VNGNRRFTVATATAASLPRANDQLALLQGGAMRLTRIAAGAATVAVLAGGGLAVAAATDLGPFGTAHVGRQPDGSVIVPTNQRVTPAGGQVEFPGRPSTLAVRPGGRTAAILNGAGTAVVIVDLDGRRLVQAFNPRGGAGSYDGLAYSADGNELFASNSDGSVLRLAVAGDGTVTLKSKIALPPQSGNPYPGGLAPSADGSKLYVALSRDNALGVIDLATQTLTARIPVGNAPHAVLVDGDRAYVSNQGGRRARTGDFTVDSSGTPIVADQQTGDPATGTVSVVDLAAGRELSSIDVGLQPTAMTLHDGQLFVANTSDDTISVVDPRAGRELTAFEVSPLPGAPHGSSPNGLAFLDDDTLAVSLGRSNAIGLYQYTGPQRATRFDGLVPTAWYPVGVAADGNGRIVVANGKGVGAVGSPAGPHSVGQQVASASILDVPDQRQVRDYTAQVMTNNDWRSLRGDGNQHGGESRQAGEQDRGGQNGDQGQDGQPPRENARPRPVPERLGEPSTIKHVVYVLKENRTYDQVLGDLGRGDGDPTLTQFGATVTPNQHALATEFPLLDNFYVSGRNSADGHQWAMQAFAPDYLEKAFGGFVRSYPFNGGDSLAYANTGFLWENALRHGRSVRAYGEYADRFAGPSNLPSWRSWYEDAQALKDGRDGAMHTPLGTYQTRSDVPSLDRLLNRDFPNYQLNIPDQYRTEIFLRELQRYVRDGEMPSLITMTLPTDHTTGVSPRYPTPQAEVADNDLALGRIIEAISRSPFWKDTAIFVTEDDAQAGVDHIDGHRTTSFVVSPWARRGIVDSRYSTQLNMVRTIEQILGLPPMNQMDLVARPMSWLFSDTPDGTPFTARPNQIPLDQGVAVPPPAATDTSIQAQWERASAQMGFGDKDFVPDSTPEQTLNHAIWYGTKGFDKPYPGEDRVLTPDEVAAKYHDGPDEVETEGQRGG
jgi:YVTN family beta-propeller protein